MSRKTLLITILVLIGALMFWIVISLRGGSTVNEDGTRTGGIGSLFPFINFGGNTPITPGEETPGTTEPGEETPITQDGPLRRISTKLTAGAIALLPVEPPKNTPPPVVKPLPIIRFVERGTGNIYDIDAHGQNEKKVSSMNIVRTAEAYFGYNGESVAIRYIKDDNRTVGTFLGKMATGTVQPGRELLGDFLPDNIIDLIMSPDGKSLLYLISSGDNSAGLTIKTDGTGRKQIFNSAFSEWLVDWTGGGMAITTKPSSRVPGYSYKVSTTGTIQRTLGNITGLTTKLSPDGKTILYSVSTNLGLELHARRLDTGSDKNLGLSTLPEKCLWLKDSITIYCGAPSVEPRAALPDDWYQGTFQFNDMIWKGDTSTGLTTKVSDGRSFDITRLTIDSEGRYLYFINKVDSSLWSYDLTPATPEPSPFPQTQSPSPQS